MVSLHCIGKYAQCRHLGRPELDETIATLDNSNPDSYRFAVSRDCLHSPLGELEAGTVGLGQNVLNAMECDEWHQRGHPRVRLF